MKIGVAISTYNRPDLLEFTLGKLREAYNGFAIVIDDCSTLEGNEKHCRKYDVAYLRNDKRCGIPRTKERGFRSLLTFDRQFWFDDDCYPKPGWLDKVLPAMEYQGHLLYLHGWAFIKEIANLGNGLLEYNSGTACFMSFRKDQYKSIHGFQGDFGKYGHWHNWLTHELRDKGVFVSIENASKYFHAFDLDGKPKDYANKFTSSLTRAERYKELKLYIARTGKDYTHNAS